MTENKPLKKIRCGQIVSTVWENDVEGKDYKVYSINIVKSYSVKEDGKDVWKTTNNFQENDLAKLALVATKTLEVLKLKVEE